MDALEQREDEALRIYQVTDGLKSAHTRETYAIGFNQFIKTTVKNDDLRVLLDTKPSVIEFKVISHIEYLKERKLKYWSILVYVSAILHFFEMNDIVLNTKKIKRFLPSDDSEHYSSDRPYSITEIQQILSKSDVRSRVIVLLMASTGMRVGAIPGLRIGDLRKFDEHNLYLIWVYSFSKKEKYYTFCTQECATAIDEYLSYRKKLGEELKDSSPLIRTKISPDNIFTTKAPRFISNKAIQTIVGDLLKQAGLLMNQKKQVMRTHGFRKFYANQCNRAHIDYPTREYLIGHKLPGQESSYNRQTEEDRLAEYEKAIPLLTLDPSVNLKNRVQELESTQAQQIDQLRAELKEWEPVKNQLLEMAEEMGITKDGKRVR